MVRCSAQPAGNGSISPGSVILSGGPGDDIFVFRPGDRGDTITDFQHGDAIQFIGTSHVEFDFTGPSGRGPLVIQYNLMEPGEGTILMAGLTMADAAWVHDGFILR